MPPTDAASPEPDDLLARARAGDAEALGRLLDPFRPYLALLARLQVGRRLRGKVDPDDLVQEAFLKAHRHFPTFAGETEAELAGWLRQILARAAADLARRCCWNCRRGSPAVSDGSPHA
jgi:RNA polymerase sigma-70 factor (ECF subfamily)